MVTYKNLRTQVQVSYKAGPYATFSSIHSLTEYLYYFLEQINYIEGDVIEVTDVGGAVSYVKVGATEWRGTTYKRRAILEPASNFDVIKILSKYGNV